MSSLSVSFADITEAYTRLAAIAQRTPVMTSNTANRMAGGELYFKCENIQRVGAFKFRGAYNAIGQFSPEQRSAGVIAYSSGNHAQGIALAARLQGTKAVIVMPSDAPSIKIEATRGYGAEVLLYDRLTENREAIGQGLAAERGLTLIPPYAIPMSSPGRARPLWNSCSKPANSTCLYPPSGVAACCPAALLR